MIPKGACLSLLAPLALVVALAVPVAAAERDIFTVAAVPVDATAANATAARDQARTDGQLRAYKILLDRLTLAADADRLPKANTALLNDVISSFEVAKEKTSAVRYLANYTFHFNAEAVRRLLRQANIPFAETPSKPLLVLALFSTGATSTLWEDPNPWREAWAKSAPATGLVPLTLPYGDLEDVSAIDAETAGAGDKDHLRTIGHRYGDVDVLVAHATLKSDANPHTLAVAATRYSPNSDQTGQSWQGSFPATAGESDADLMARAVAATSQQIQDAWKKANLLDFGKSTTIVVRVPIADLASWVAVRDRLAATPAIKRANLLALDRAEARVSINFYGDANQLRVALAQRDLALSGDDPDWTLERRAADKP
jgi:hypothetical protein